MKAGQTFHRLGKPQTLPVKKSLFLKSVAVHITRTPTAVSYMYLTDNVDVIISALGCDFFFLYIKLRM